MTTDATTAAVQTSLIWVETTHVSGSSFSSYSAVADVAAVSLAETIVDVEMITMVAVAAA